VNRSFGCDEMKQGDRTDNGNWLRVEILDVFPTNLGHCPHFNLLTHEMGAMGDLWCPFTDQTEDYPKYVKEAHHRVADVIRRMKNALGDLPVNVSVDMVEAMTVKGTLKGIRHRFRKQSGVIVNGRKFAEGYPLPPDFEARLRSEAVGLLRG
jgi:hypothetical protein